MGYPRFRYVKSLPVLFHLDWHIASEPRILGGQPPDIATLDPKSAVSFGAESPP